MEVIIAFIQLSIWAFGKWYKRSSMNGERGRNKRSWINPSEQKRAFKGCDV